MKTRRRVWGTVLVVLTVAIAIAVLVFHLSEPEYHGKPLSHWLAQLSGEPPHDPPVPEAEVAVRAIGTKALPFLLRSLTAEDSRIKQALMELEASHSKINLGLKSTDRRVGEAMKGYMALAEIAEPAVPDLVALVNGQGERASHAAGAVLPYLGPAGIEATIKLLSNTNSALRRNAEFNLASPVLNGTNQNRCQGFTKRYRQQAAQVVPALLGLLNDNDAGVAKYAAFSLGWLRWRPDEVIPALTNLAVNQVAPLEVRVGAIGALGRFGKTEGYVVPFLHSLSNDANIRRAASSALRRIGGATSNVIDAVK